MCNIDWDVLGTWLGSIGTVGAFIVVFIQIAMERRARKRENNRRQAQGISAWISGLGFDRTYNIYTVLNNSSEPVYQVIITPIDIQGPGPSNGIEVDKYDGTRVFLDILPPGKFNVNNHKRIDHSISMHFVLEISFTDSQGKHWIRKGNGQLEEIQLSPLKYYNIGLPVEWLTPTED